MQILSLYILIGTLFSAFTEAAGLSGIDITQAPVIAGLMIGGMLLMISEKHMIQILETI